MHNLTERELQVLTGICQGHSQKIIADELKIKPDTVKFHAHNIYRKLGAINAANAAFIAGVKRLI